MTNLKTWKDGQAVTGTYCNVKFAGRIDSSSSRMMPDGKTFMFSVNLDSPISVYGQERTAVEIPDNSANRMELVSCQK